MPYITCVLSHSILGSIPMLIFMQAVVLFTVDIFSLLPAYIPFLAPVDRCPRLILPSGTVVYENQRRTGSLAHLICDVGFYSKNATVSCDASSTWNSSFSPCERMYGSDIGCSFCQVAHCNAVVRFFAITSVICNGAVCD